MISETRKQLEAAKAGLMAGLSALAGIMGHTVEAPLPPQVVAAMKNVTTDQAKTAMRIASLDLEKANQRLDRSIAKEAQKTPR